MVVNSRDITERKRAEEEIKDSELRFRQLFDHSLEALIIHDAEGNIVDVNPETCHSLGYTREELLELRASDLTDDLLSPEEKSEQERSEGTLWQRTVAGDPRVQNTVHHGEHKSKDGTKFPIEVRVGGVDYGGERMVLASVRDVTERKRLEEELEHQAFHDPLTGLPNRILFTESLDQALQRAARFGKVLATLFLDLDHFKFINDSLGHDLGDRLLTQVAARLRACLRQTDIAGRLGGDEFIVLVEEIDDAGGAVLVAERIEEALQKPFSVGGREMFVTFSIGISVSTDGSEEPAALLRDADTAMYRAKHGGKARYEIFDESMSTRPLRHLELETDLRHAVERGEITVYYQPKVNAETGKIRGAEALARWESPGRGMVQPLEFIPVAEETGLIMPLGQSVLEEACLQTKQWQESYPMEPPLTVSVNLSAKQLESPGLIEDVQRALHKSGLAPSDLTLEITESVMMHNVEATAEALQRLKEIGVKIAVDDFGTGYSSLSHIQRLPIDIINIDQTFVEGLGRRTRDMAIVSSVMLFAHTLGITVVAEGVETAEQLARLRNLDCDLAQGFYFVWPLPAAQASDYMAAGFCGGPG